MTRPDFEKSANEWYEWWIALPLSHKKEKEEVVLRLQNAMKINRSEAIGIVYSLCALINVQTRN